MSNIIFNSGFIMKKFPFFVPFLCLTSFYFAQLTSTEPSLNKNNFLQSEMIEDLNILKHNMSVKYAPKEIKNTLFGWDLENEYQLAKSKILETHPQNSNDYQKIFKNLVTSTKDYHVSTHFYSREMSLFPIAIKEAEGRYFISSTEFSLNLDIFDYVLMDAETIATWVENINESMEGKPNYQIGDEILAIDGVSPKSLIENIIDNELGGDHSPTGYSLANSILFNKLGKYGHETCKGSFRLTLLPKGQNQPVTYRLPWLHFSEDVLNRGLNLTKGENKKPNIGSVDQMKKAMQKDFSVKLAKELTAPHKSNLLNQMIQPDNENEIWYVKGFLPNLGKIVWKTEDSSQLYAYIYKHKSGKQIGYIYLPTFMYPDLVIEDVVEDLTAIMAKINKESDALILDITNNPGGRSDYMNTVLSMLSDKPLTCHQHQELLIQEDVYRAMAFKEYIKYFEEDETLDEAELLKIEQIKEYFTQIIDDYKAGRKITEPLYLFGEKQVIPHSGVQYTKPLLILVNELDFSCGDFFPAVLQDNRRGTIFGKKTAGAGGYVNYFLSSSRFGVVGYSLTGSVGYRADGTLIENLGVTPDVEHDFTIRDLQHNYQDYINALNRQIETMVIK